MAGVDSNDSCQTLLRKLKKGQGALRMSISSINPPSEVTSASNKVLRERKLAKQHRDSMTIQLDKVRKLPKKRARLQQLSPEYEVSPMKPLRKHPRRQSSTPVQKQRSQSNADLSLEAALFDKENAMENANERTLPSPRLSKIVVDTSRSFMSDEGGVNTSSALKKDGRRKNKRGLTVSFVQQEEDGDKNTRKAGTPVSGRSRFSRHATQRNMDPGLITSLNSSRYGAMERRYSQTRPQTAPKGRGGSTSRSSGEGHFPTTCGGNDPRLGYDWIAGLLDASDSYLSEKDDDYFEEIDEFRRVNYGDCHRPDGIMLPSSAVEHPQEETSEDEEMEGHPPTTCVRSYMLNDRLFPINTSSMDHPPRNECPACEDKAKATKKSATRYIRVSVPDSVLHAPDKLRPHRRGSFDPTDSMGLTKHCMAGWDSAKPSTMPPQSTVNLRSLIPKDKRNTHKPNLDMEIPGESLLDTSYSIEYNLRSRSGMN